MRFSTILVLLVSLLTASALPLTSRPPQHSQNKEDKDDPRLVRQASDCTPGKTCTNSTVLTAEGEVNEDLVNSTIIDEEEMASSQGACQSLKQLLKKEFNKWDDLKVDNSVFPLFVYPEIFNLDHENFKKKDTETNKQTIERNCHFLKRDLNEQMKNSICLWNYTCNYRENEFPRYQLEVTQCSLKSDLRAEIVNRVECRDVNQQMHYAKKDSNGCWKAHDKTVRIGCKCVVR